VSCCAICGKEIHNARHYFCLECYERWREEILTNKEWILYLEAQESKRRREEKKKWGLVYLDDGYDISDSGKLIKLYVEDDEDY
jgi:hypothetical protein